jgi:16S rRNA processing protein RimM
MIMHPEDCHYLGYISKAIGFEGSLLTFFEAADPSSFKELETIFIMIDGKLVPFFIEDFSYHGRNKEIIIKFEDIDTSEKARQLCDHQMYLPKSVMPQNPENRRSFKDIPGFIALLEDHTQLGVVKEVLEYPGNPVFRIMKDQQEILVPANEDFIHSIDFKYKQIILTLPEGLLDLYPE